MREAERQHRAALVAHRTKIFEDENNGMLCVFATLAGVVAIGCALAGFGGSAVWFYGAAFCAAVAGAFMMPVIFALLNRA